MGCPLSFRLLFTYCSREVPEQIRRTVLTPDGTHPHSNDLFLLFSIFPTPAFFANHLQIGRSKTP